MNTTFIFIFSTNILAVEMIQIRNVARRKRAGRALSTNITRGLSRSTFKKSHRAAVDGRVPALSTQTPMPSPSARHHHHLHLFLNREGRWGTTDDFATTFLNFSLFSTALWDLPNPRPVRSLMLSSHLFSVCLAFFPFSLCLAK